jgi:hypothetical protein
MLLNTFSSNSQSGFTTSSEVLYNFSYQQNQFFPVPVISYRLNTHYYVSERTGWDLRKD